MKPTLFIILLLLSNAGFSQEIKFLSEYYEFKNGEIAYMFGNNVKLREQPNTTSGVLSLLKIGEQIEIIEKTDIKIEFDGIKSPWYKVKTKGAIGFVPGNFISLDQALYGNIIYLVSLNKYQSKLFLKTRVLGNGSEFKENMSELATADFSIKATGGRGLENVKSIFEVNYLAEACGVDGGGIYLFYDGTSLNKAINYMQIFDAGIYWLNEEYIFPTDEEGVKGKIVYKREVGEMKDEETEWTENIITRRILTWNGKEVIPKLEGGDE